MLAVWAGGGAQAASCLVIFWDSAKDTPHLFLLGKREVSGPCHLSRIQHGGSTFLDQARAKRFFSTPNEILPRYSSSGNSPARLELGPGDKFTNYYIPWKELPIEELPSPTPRPTPANPSKQYNARWERAGTLGLSFAAATAAAG